MDPGAPSPSKNMLATINEIYNNLNNASKLSENISFFPLVLNFVSKFSFVPIGYLCLSKIYLLLDYFSEAENISLKGLEIVKSTKENIFLENDLKEIFIKSKYMLKKTEEAQKEMSIVKKEGFSQLYSLLDSFRKDIKKKYEYMVIFFSFFLIFMRIVKERGRKTEGTELLY